MAGKKKTDTAAIAAVAKQTEKLKKAVEEAKAAEAKGAKLKKSMKTSKGDSSRSRSPSPVKKSKMKSNDEEEKEKRPPNAYQVYRKAKLAELRDEYDDEETRPSYQDLMKMVNEAWHEENPKKEKIPKEKKERKSKKDTDDGEKKKRAPSAYNLFIKEIMPSIKTEHENDEPKLTQKDYMKLAAQKWNEHKIANNI